MRLWSISPCYLDSKGLIALWREGLLAKKVLEGKTKGYKNHPQLGRFKNYYSPIEAINSYLTFVYLEAKNRGYNFSEKKIALIEREKIIKVSFGQISYEFKHLLNKLKIRDPERFEELRFLKPDSIKPHPIFEITESREIESWEKIYNK